MNIISNLLEIKYGLVFLCLIFAICCDNSMVNSTVFTTNLSEKDKFSNDLVVKDDEINILLNILSESDKKAREKAKSKLIQLTSESKERRERVLNSISFAIKTICNDSLATEPSERRLQAILDILLIIKPEELYDTLAQNLRCGTFRGGLSKSANPISSILPSFGDSIVPYLRKVIINGNLEERATTALILGRINSNDSQKVLEEAFKQEKEEFVRQRIQFSLDRRNSTP